MRTVGWRSGPHRPFLCGGDGLGAGDLGARGRPAARAGRVGGAPEPDGGVPGAGARSAAHVGAVLGRAGTGAGARAGRSPRARAGGPEPVLPVFELDDGAVVDGDELELACPSSPSWWTWSPHWRPARRRRRGRRSARRWPGRCEGGSAWLVCPFVCVSAGPFEPVLQTVRSGSECSRRATWAGARSHATNAMTIHSNASTTAHRRARRRRAGGRTLRHRRAAAATSSGGSALGRPPAVGAHRDVDDVEPGEGLVRRRGSASWPRDAARRASSSMVMTAL